MKYLSSGYSVIPIFFQASNLPVGCYVHTSEWCHLAFTTPEGVQNASHEQNNLAEAKDNSRFNQLSGKNELFYFFQWAISVVCKYPSKVSHGGIYLVPT